MRDSVFLPLGMTNTFVFSIKDTANYVPTYMGSRPFLLDFLDCTYGDKNIYSTVRDLLKWDAALYQNSFVSAATLDSAIIPRSHETPSKHNYGYGWRLFYSNGDTIIYHNGRWHGSNTVFARMPQDTTTVIVLGNKFNRNIYKAKEIFSVFTGKRDTTTLVE
jgi:CubicO group peptidase (beta-lactamase class C family)